MRYPISPRALKALLSVSLTTLIGLGSSPGVLAQTPTQTLVIGADLWCPYNCEENADAPGYLVEIARKALAREGRTVVYKVLPWSRALEETRLGRMDVAIGAVSGNYTGLIINRISLGRDQTAVVTMASNPWRYRGPDSLREILVGVIADYTYDANGPIDQYIWGRDDESQVVVLHRENALQLLIRMLDSRRVDGFLENRFVALYSARQMGLEDRFLIQETGQGDDIYFAFNPTVGGQRLAQEFDRALLELDAQGEIERIMTRYGLPYVPLAAH